MPQKIKKRRRRHLRQREGAAQGHGTLSCFSPCVREKNLGGHLAVGGKRSTDGRAAEVPEED